MQFAPHIYTISVNYKIFPTSRLIKTSLFLLVDGYWCVVWQLGILCVFVVISLACFKTVSFFNHIFIILLLITFYLKCTVTSYCFIILLNQTAEVKTLPIAHVTQSHNSRPVIPQTVGRSRGLWSRTDHSFWHSWRYKLGTLHCFLLVLSITLLVPLH